MKKTIIIFLLLVVSLTMAAKLRIVTTYPYIKDIAARIGKDKVSVKALAKGNWDPHVIVPRPSLIARVRKADLLIINGAQLEIGWIPPVLRQANNAVIMPSKKGFLDLSNSVKLIQVPDSVSRAQGDVHPAGNPHYCTDPYNIPLLANAITEKLMDIDPDNREYYRNNRVDLLKKWKIKLAEWDKKMITLKGKKYLEFHRNLDYFLERYGCIVIDTIEPLPGIPPTSKHTLALIRKLTTEKTAKILHDAYHSQKCSKFISRKTNTPYIIIPHDVYAVKQAKDIFSLFDEIIRRLTL